MGQVSTIGLDIAKRVFQAHGADASGHVVFRKRLMRDKLLALFAAQPPCVVALEACSGVHHWGRELGKLGHTVRLIPSAYVKPYVKRQKNDAASLRWLAAGVRQRRCPIGGGKVKELPFSLTSINSDMVSRRSIYFTILRAAPVLIPPA